MAMLPGGIAKGQTYKALYDKYGGCDYPMARVELAGKAFEKNAKQEAFIHDIYIDLSCGFEASMARFRIYDVYDIPTGKYKYDQVKDRVLLGASLKIWIGYSYRFEHVFTGFVASVDFGFEEDGIAYIEVTGMDAKGVMMASSYAAQLTAKSYGEAVREVLRRTAYEKMKTSEIISQIAVSDTPDKQQGGGKKASAETIEMVSESDYEFIMKAAKKFNYEFFVDRGKVIFRKARSETQTLLSIGVGQGVLDWRLGYSLTGMVEQIEVRSLDPGQGKVVRAKGSYKGNLSTGGKAKALIKGSRRVYIDPTVFSQEQANARLDSLMTQMSYRLGTLECSCVGLPEYVPGRFCEVAVGGPCDNSFYITNVRHEFTMNGVYKTFLTGQADTVRK
ncbi:MAG: hypothetical protein LBR44_10710 [Clostridiales Family XIII bacterium]|jgi:phage protein D|nr:hypothetical protein [Clostridiales Family XIII bacterium]